MTERFKIHSMISGMNVGETMDLELCKELIEKYGSIQDIDVFITDNGENMTYKEVVDKLNGCDKRNQILEQSKQLKDLVNEVERLKRQNKLLQQREEVHKLNDIENSTMEKFLKNQR